MGSFLPASLLGHLALSLHNYFPHLLLRQPSLSVSGFRSKVSPVAAMATATVIPFMFGFNFISSITAFHFFATFHLFGQFLLLVSDFYKMSHVFITGSQGGNTARGLQSVRELKNSAHHGQTLETVMGLVIDRDVHLLFTQRFETEMLGTKCVFYAITHSYCVW